ncbi:MAG: metallophosphoesterase [Deltaproteobacteria bacterium]|nr:metallophosphoesterase [Nannocystaceae bacterium]
MSTESMIALAVYAATVLAAFGRNRLYGTFALVVLMFPTLVGNALRDSFGPLAPVVLYAQIAAAVHFGAMVIRPQLRGLAFRSLVSYPALWFVAGSMLAFPWAIVAGFGGEPYGAWIPYLLCLGGLGQSLYTKRERVDLVLDGREVEVLGRHPAGMFRDRAPSRQDRPLRIVQITDPHLGPFMPIARLQGICERAVAEDPDLIVVTGDLMTMESHDEAVVTAALAPLAQLRGRVFACHGNHDHEARMVVANAYAKHGIRLLIDEATLVETPSGPVQIVGADFVWRDRPEHLRRLADRHPRMPGALRLWLLHDPGAFKHLPAGEGDLVLSGHTHGGQVGLLSLGLPHTFLSMVSSIPDHGLWARGRDRLYVHRANGHYGYPIRLGVPAEESVLHVWRDAESAG